MTFQKWIENFFTNLIMPKPGNAFKRWDIEMTANTKQKSVIEGKGQHNACEHNNNVSMCVPCFLLRVEAEKKALPCVHEHMECESVGDKYVAKCLDCGLEKSAGWN